MTLNVFTAALNQTPLDWEGNQQRILAALAQAKEEGAQVVLLPELCISGYGCEDMFFASDTLTKSLESLSQIKNHCQDLLVALSLPIQFDNKVFNCVAMVQNQRILGLSAKKSLAHTGVYYEPRWFQAWPAGKQDVIEISGEEVPIGDLVYAFGSLGVGLEICEEAWIEKPYHFRKPVSLVLNPSASNFEMGKYTRRVDIVTKQAHYHQAHYLYTNLVGLEAGRVIYDGSMLLADPQGSLISSAERFSYKKINSFCTTIHSPKMIATNEAYVQGEPLALHDTVKPKNALANAQHLTKNQEFLEAACLGLYGYLEKSKAQGFVLSLSGGRDSGCVAILAATMLKLAEQNIGLAEMQRQLPHLKSLAINDILTCLYQSSENSSTQTTEAAQALATELGAKFHNFNIQPLIHSVLNEYKEQTQQQLEWSAETDTSLQNLQARSRVQMPWLIANLEQKILLSTGNRSEASCGYTTMDGDSAGGLAPLAGVSKHFINQWLAWVAKPSQNLSGIQSVQKILAIPATAELRPPSAEQSDEADLMPFAILDRIEALLIGRKESPEETLTVLVAQFPEYSKDQLQGFLSKFQRLWHTNQWKRERLAPSFHLDEYSLDPKTWCRFPILSGPSC